MDLFEHALRERLRREAPLAARLRPPTLEEFIGQEEIIGEGRLLRRAIENDRLFSSILLWGPPGSGKTTLASIIAHRTQAHFESISAVLAGIAELRRGSPDARTRRSTTGCASPAAMPATPSTPSSWRSSRLRRRTER